jgi:NUMOD1 domain
MVTLNSPEHKARKRERMKFINSNPEQQAKRLVGLNIYNASLEHKEHLKKLQERSSFKVEIFDVLNNETTVYNSVRAASREIGCAKDSILKALNYLEEKGVPRFIKKRYKAKRVF